MSPLFFASIITELLLERCDVATWSGKIGTTKQNAEFADWLTPLSLFIVEAGKEVPAAKIPTKPKAGYSI